MNSNSPSASVPISSTTTDRIQLGSRTWFRFVPNSLVLLALCGVAVWGHFTGWTIPRFSHLLNPGAAAADDWCPEHGVPESICVECKDSILPKIKSTYCRTHGVHLCPFEQPELTQLAQPPAVTPMSLQRAQLALELKPRPSNNPRCKIQEQRLQFVSEAVMNKMGIDIAPAWEGPIVETVSASGEIVYEQPRVAPVGSPVAGRVWHVTEQGLQGATVKRGDVLALVDAAEIGKAKAELLQAYAQAMLKDQALENLKALDKDLRAVNLQAGVPAPQMQAAQGAVSEARIRVLGAQQALVNLGLPLDLDQIKGMTSEDLARHLHFFGIPAQLAQRLSLKTTTASLFPILAPRDGVVSVSKVATGEIVDPSKTLFVVADTSQMWVVLNVRLEDMKYLRVRETKAGRSGQEVRFRPDGGGAVVHGELTWRSTEVDDRTRTVQFRAEIANPDGSLLAHTFGTGEVVLREEKKAVLVPNEALHWEGDCNIVFVRDKDFLKDGAPKVFHVRTVRPGVRTQAETEIIAGLLPGEVVATKNSASIRAQLLKNRLGEC